MLFVGTKAVVRAENGTIMILGNSEYKHFLFDAQGCGLKVESAMHF